MEIDYYLHENIFNIHFLITKYLSNDIMKTISEYIQEASINAKNRREQFAKSLFDIDGKNHKLFHTIGIITGENPDSTQQTPQVNAKLMNDFKKDLKRNNIVYIPIKVNSVVIQKTHYYS